MVIEGVTVPWSECQVKCEVSNEFIHYNGNDSTCPTI